MYAVVYGESPAEAERSEKAPEECEAESGHQKDAGGTEAVGGPEAGRA